MSFILLCLLQSCMTHWGSVDGPFFPVVSLRSTSLFMTLTSRRFMLTPHPRLVICEFPIRATQACLSMQNRQQELTSAGQRFHCLSQIMYGIATTLISTSRLTFISQSNDLKLMCFYFQNIDLSCACYRSPMSKKLGKLSWL